MITQQTIAPVVLGTPAGEFDAIQASFTARDDDLTAAGIALGLATVVLSDGSRRAVVVYCVGEDEVGDMTSNQAKRDAIAIAIHSAAAALP